MLLLRSMSSGTRVGRAQFERSECSVSKTLLCSGFSQTVSRVLHSDTSTATSRLTIPPGVGLYYHQHHYWDYLNIYSIVVRSISLYFIVQLCFLIYICESVCVYALFRTANHTTVLFAVHPHPLPLLSVGMFYAHLYYSSSAILLERKREAQ